MRLAAPALEVKLEDDGGIAAWIISESIEIALQLLA